MFLMKNKTKEIRSKVSVETIRLLRVYTMKEIKIRHTRLVTIKEQNMTQQMK